MRSQTLLAPVSLTGFLWLGACASSEGPQILTIAPGTYEQAFDAAVEAARRQGLISVVKDRRSGVIETDPTVASTIFEPWRGGNASLHQAFDNTLNFQRRRARFEFAPIGFDPARAAAADEPTGPIAVTAAPLSPDLTEFTGDLELRVNVVIERAYMPGMQLNDWTQYYPTRTIIIPPGDANDPAEPLPAIFWTGVSRDAAFERRLLAAVQKALHGSHAKAASAAAASPAASGLIPLPPREGPREGEARVIEPHRESRRPILPQPIRGPWEGEDLSRPLPRLPRSSARLPAERSQTDCGECDPHPDPTRGRTVCCPLPAPLGRPAHLELSGFSSRIPGCPSSSR